MRTPVALPPILKWMEQRMPQRRRFTQTTSLEESLAKEATQLRKQAQGTPRALRATFWFAKPAEPRQLSYDEVAGLGLQASR
jgi:hypothetical protein